MLHFPLGKGDKITIAPGAPAAQSLGITYVSQRPNQNWCWSASCIMVFTYFGITRPNGQPLTQCELASWAFSPADCCSNPLSGACDNGLFPNAVYEQYGLSLPSSLVPPDNLVTMTFEQIQEEIGTYYRPIEPYLTWNDGGSHLIVISGYSSDKKLHVLDPWFGDKGWVQFSELQQAYGLGTWAGTYSGFIKR